MLMIYAQSVHHYYVTLQVDVVHRCLYCLLHPHDHRQLKGVLENQALLKNAFNLSSSKVYEMLSNHWLWNYCYCSVDYFDLNITSRLQKVSSAPFKFDYDLERTAYLPTCRMVRVISVGGGRPIIFMSSLASTTLFYM